MDAHGGTRLTERKFTDEQQRAITARGVSVALSAGAGCGKTFALTERFLFQLQPQGQGEAGPARLGQLVAITFTERAAREMRDRIRAACGERLRACPDDQVDYWLPLIRELDTARISTIHSFCATLLRVHAVEARLDPRFRVLDQSQAETLFFELLGEHLHDRLVDRDEAAIELLVQFGLPRLQRMTAALLGQRQEIDWAAWRGETPESLVARWQAYWRSTFLPAALGRIVRSPAAQSVLEIAGQQPPSHAAMRLRCELLLEELPKLPQTADAPAALAAIREAAKVQGGGGKKAWPNEEIYERFRAAAESLRKVIDQTREQVAFDPQAALPAAAASLRLLTVAEGVAEVYDRRKQELGVLDFDDLLLRARDLLAGPDQRELRKRLASQIRLLLVDEFQDTDPLQAELVEALCDDQLLGGKLFFVGDYKQSIYRFRGAQPRIFRRLREKVPPGGRLPLSMNFRSQPAVLDFVNALFCEALGPEYEPLRPHREQVAPVPAIEFLWASDSVEDDPASSAATGAAAGAADNDESRAEPNGPAAIMGDAERLRRREADWIARRIRGMLDAGERIVWDKEAAAAGKPAVRAVRPGDIALLFRALSNVELYEEALRRYGIEYYLVGGRAFYGQQEVFDLLNLLRAVCSPNDEVSLAGVLRSPWFGLLDETLFWLAQHSQGLAAGLFAQRLPAELSQEQRRRVKFAAATLGELRAIKDRLPIAGWIDEALARTGFDAVLLAEFLGERKLANLRKLIEQARDFDRAGIFSMADFVTQLAEFVARQPDEALAATQPESTDVVRLMTIHQSKGLEFPVVIVPDIDRVRHGSGSLVAFTRELGPMVKDPDACGGFDLYTQTERDEEHEELLRLLYVATTRAADYLILSAGMNAAGGFARPADQETRRPGPGWSGGPWTELLNSRFDLLDGALRGRLPEGYRVPKIRVTTSEPPLRSERSGGTARPDLPKLIEEAQQMAGRGEGRVPPLVAPLAADPAARRQLSFSRLNGTLHAPVATVQPEGPAMEWDSEPLLDPRGLGTLIHAVLAEVDFANPGDIAALVRRHAQRHLPESDGELAEPIDMVRRFLASPRAAALAAAPQVHTELEFLLAWPPGQKQPAGRYLQGFIDCLYQDSAGQWHLVDYKTNRVAAGGLGAVAAGYEMQMLVYALAIERILKQPPADLTLCFLRPDLEYHFAWDDAARRRAVELVDRAIAGLAGS